MLTACKTAKEFLSSRGVEFKEKDIREGPEALRELIEAYRSSTMPTLVAGERVSIRFDPLEYQAALRAPGQ